MSNIGIYSGYKPSPKDLIVEAFSAQKLGLVKNASVNNQHIITEYTPLSNQLQTNTCVANSSVDALEILLGQNNKSVVQLSRLFTYWNARMLDQTTDKDGGTFIHNAFQTLQSLGTCPEDMWQFDPSLIFTQPSYLCYKEANDHKLSGAYRINSEDDARAEDVESAIFMNCPVVFGTGVNKVFEDYAGEDIVLDTPQNVLGYHAMVIVGVRHNPNREFYVRNSWGNWGMKGHVWISENYIKSGVTTDLWVPTVAPKLF